MVLAVDFGKSIRHCDIATTLKRYASDDRGGGVGVKKMLHQLHYLPSIPTALPPPVSCRLLYTSARAGPAPIVHTENKSQANIGLKKQVLYAVNTGNNILKHHIATFIDNCALFRPLSCLVHFWVSREVET